MAQRKTFSFSQEYMEEYNYLLPMKNPSEYICMLIRKDLQAKTEAKAEAKAKEDEEDETFTLKDIASLEQTYAEQRKHFALQIKKISEAYFLNKKN